MCCQAQQSCQAIAVSAQSVLSLPAGRSSTASRDTRQADGSVGSEGPGGGAAVSGGEWCSPSVTRPHMSSRR